MSDAKAPEVKAPEVKGQAAASIKLSDLGALLDGIQALQTQKKKSVLVFTKEKDQPGNKDASYKFREGEENHVHVRTWRRGFDTETGKKKHKENVMIFEPKREWVQFLDNMKAQGLEIVKILHFPDGAMDPKVHAKKMLEAKKAEQEAIEAARTPNR